MIRALSILIILVGISFSSWKKKDDPQPAAGSDALTFTSLTVEKSTIDFGTLLTATATGQDLTYVWSTSVGILSRSGNDNSAEKKISITVE